LTILLFNRYGLTCSSRLISLIDDGDTYGRRNLDAFTLGNPFITSTRRHGGHHLPIHADA
jgi:hypothetical protein